jgi:hypothetical protein
MQRVRRAHGAGQSWRRFALCCVLGLTAAGCASRPVLLEQSSYWPFEKIRLQSAAVGELTVYAQRPEQAVRAVVIVQSPPCAAPPAQSADPRLSTAGVLWDELKHDSLLLQLERPGVRREELESGAPDCRLELADITPAAWSQAVRDALNVATGDLRLPTTYIGIGEGAWPAAQLAATDPRAAMLFMVNATGLNPGFESLLAEVRNIDGAPAQDLFAGVPDISAIRLANPDQPATLPVKVPTLLVQSTASRDSRLESALLLLSQHRTKDPEVSLLVVEGLGTDFGLDGGKIQCFENLMRLIAQRTRQEAPAGFGAITRTYCSMPDRALPVQPRTEPLRLPNAPLTSDPGGAAD